ncbi:hydrophobin family protein [Phanerochaete sordida]|uniref:Hydrophobin n=1 Tax=Phanerochaete sordida TaxID=48140 RepID=A0A9P3LB68_9APHY|nr:hydrophobin family protein [Phanerochaete sordida]
MFAKLAALTTLALPLLAVATPAPLAARQSDVQCCNSTEDANSAAGTALLGLLGIAVQDVTGLIALDCSPISVIGVGSGSACSGTTVSCTNNEAGGIGIGCVPVSL